MSEVNEILVYVPPELAKYQRHLQRFMMGMIQKLYKNRHKDTPTLNTVPDIIEKLEAEIEEFQEQFFGDPQHENNLIELYDVANFAFLAYIAMRNQGVDHESAA